MTALATLTAKALVTVLETGHARGRYGALEGVPGPRGALTYGIAGARVADGTLGTLVERYAGASQARLGKALAMLLPPLRDRNPALHGDVYFHNLLRAAADDPVMQALQDASWDAAFWDPALTGARKHGLETPLGLAVLADSLGQGGFETLRRRIVKEHGPVNEIGEPAWLTAYATARADWLAGHRTRALRDSVGRMRVFQTLMRLGNWDLRLPLVIHGVEIDAALLTGPAPGTYDGPGLGSRTVQLEQPLVRGGDVRAVQLALSGLTVGRDLLADGIYGPVTQEAVRGLQDAMGIAVTGVVDAATLAFLPL